MHFLTKLLNGTIDDTVHHAFLRYGKGDYEGPVVHVSVSQRGKIIVKSSYLYQDLVACTFLQVVPENIITVSGIIIGYEPLDEALVQIGISSTPFTKKRATRLFQASINGSLSRDQLFKLYDKVGEYAYIFCSLNASGGWIHKSKTKLPSPKKILPLADQLKFSTTHVPAGTNFLIELLSSLAPDFEEDLPSAFSSLRLTNNYLIHDLIFPSNREQLSSTEIRLKTKRKGVLHRVLYIDDVEYFRDHDFVA